MLLLQDLNLCQMDLFRVLSPSALRCWLSLREFLFVSFLSVDFLLRAFSQWAPLRGLSPSALSCGLFVGSFVCFLSPLDPLCGLLSVGFRCVVSLPWALLRGLDVVCWALCCVAGSWLCGGLFVVVFC